MGQAGRSFPPAAIRVDWSSVKEELAPAVLISAYASGVFPMSDAEGQISWYAPDPRAIIALPEFHVPRKLGRRYRQGQFELVVNRDFPAVIRACANREEGTWISRDMEQAYVQLHRLGLAHSVECYEEERLAGGLYGVALGAAFFGESMFHRERDVSKFALVYLVERMRKRGYKLLDVQFLTAHLARFGAKEIPRNEYLVRLRVALKTNCRFAD